MELQEVGTIIKQEFALLSGGRDEVVYLQCTGCSELLDDVKDLDAAIKWADQHEQESHMEPSI